MTDIDKIEQKIKKLLQPLCPTIDLNDMSSAYHTSFIKEMIEVFTKVENNPRALSYSEKVQVTILNDVRDQMLEDLIKNKVEFIRYGYEPKNEYEHGVLAAIALIEFRVHCICDY